MGSLPDVYTEGQEKTFNSSVYIKVCGASSWPAKLYGFKLFILRRFWKKIFWWIQKYKKT